MQYCRCNLHLYYQQLIELLEVEQEFVLAEYILEGICMGELLGNLSHEDPDK